MEKTSVIPEAHKTYELLVILVSDTFNMVSNTEKASNIQPNIASSSGNSEQYWVGHAE